MRVICVTIENFHAGGINESGIQVGDVYDVIHDAYGIDKAGNRIPCYKLSAFVGTPYVHDKRNFAILPNEDADEMAEAEKEAILC